MDPLTTHDGSAPGARPDDDTRWQCALNEGWPERTAPGVARPSGAVAPVMALARPDNVVDLDLWRRERPPHRQTAADRNCVKAPGRVPTCP
jgi:hypothetical protein